MTNGYTPAQWHDILRNAHAALQANPGNSRARTALKAAVAAVAQEQQAISAQENVAASQPDPGTLGSAVTGFGEGASLGLASKLGNLLPGPSNTAYLAAARQTHPLATFGGDLAGSATLGTLLGVNPLLRGLTSTAKGVTIGGLLGAGRGAVEAPPGERLLGAGIGGGLGAATGYVGGKIAGKLAPAVRTIAKNLRAPPAAGTAEEVAVAKQLGLPLEAVRGKVGGAAVQAARARSSVTPVPTLEPPPSTKTPLQKLSTGKTVPYYPRGGQTEQAIPPPPQVSPVGPRFPRAGRFLFNALAENPLRVRQLTTPELTAALRFGRGSPELADLVVLLTAEAQRRAGGFLAPAGGLLRP